MRDIHIDDDGFPPQIQKRMKAGMGCHSGIGKGWLPIVEKLDADLAELVPDYTIDQIKQKLGGLRYYTGSVPKDVQQQVYQLITDAEILAEETCEVCGELGSRHVVKGYIQTKCKEHT